MAEDIISTIEKMNQVLDDINEVVDVAGDNPINGRDATVVKNGVTKSVESKINAKKIFSSDDGKDFLWGVHNLRGQYEVSRDGIFNLSTGDKIKWIGKFYSGEISEIEKELEGQPPQVMKAVLQRFVNKKLATIQNTPKDLATNSDYVIQQTADGFEYVPSNDDNKDFPATTGQLMQAYATAVTNEGVNLVAEDVYDAYSSATGNPAMSRGSNASMLGDMLAPRSYKMESDDEFASRNGGKAKARKLDAVEFGLNFVPWTNVFGKVLKAGKYAINLARDGARAYKGSVPIARIGAGVDGTLGNIVNNKYIARAVDIAKGGATNIGDAAVGDAVGYGMDKVYGTNRGGYGDALGYAVAGILGSAGKFVAPKKYMTRAEAQQAIFNHLLRSEGGLNEVQKLGFNAPGDIDDMTIKLFNNEIGADDYTKAVLGNTYDGTMVQHNPKNFPKERTKTVEVVDEEALPQAQKDYDEYVAQHRQNYEDEVASKKVAFDQRAADIKSFTDRRNKKAMDKYYKNQFRADFRNNEQAFRFDDLAAQAKFEQSKRQFMNDIKAQGLRDDLINLYENDFRKAVEENDYWRDRFEKSNANYQKVFWDFLRERRKLGDEIADEATAAQRVRAEGADEESRIVEDIIQSNKARQVARDAQNAPYEEPGLPVKKPNKVQYQADKQALASMPVANARADFSSLKEQDLDQIEALLNSKTLPPDMEEKVRRVYNWKKRASRPTYGGRNAPNLASGEAMARIEDEMIPVIPQRVSDEQLFASGGYTESQRRLKEAKKLFDDAKNVPIEPKKAGLQTFTKPKEEVVERPTYKNGGLLNPTRAIGKFKAPKYTEPKPFKAPTKKVKVVDTDNITPMTDAEWKEWAKANWRDMGSSSYEEFVDNPRANEWRAMLSTFYDKESPRQLGIWNTRQRTLKEARTDAANLDQNAADNSGTGKKKSVEAYYKRHIQTTGDKELDEQIKKAMKEFADKSEIAKKIGKDIPTIKESTWKYPRAFAEYAIPTLGRIFVSPADIKSRGEYGDKWRLETPPMK